MLEVTEAASSRLAGLRVTWTRVTREGEPQGALPDPTHVLPVGAPQELTDHPVSQAYRQLFWDLGIDPTKQRPAGEALARRLTRGAPMPRIQPLVDAYNLASAATLVPISAFDLDHVAPPIRLALAEEGDRFEPIGSDPVTVEAGRPVWEDGKGIISLVGYRDGQRTALSEDSTDAVIIAVGPREAGPRVLPEAMRMLEQYVSIAGWRMASAPETAQL